MTKLKTNVKLFNTLSREIEDFKPIQSGKVGMYVCGPTTYDKSHIGHARTYVFFDFFRRFLEFKKFDVNFIINLTDIDDKIIKKAGKNQEWQTVTDIYSRYFIWMLEKLRIKMPTTFPRVTNHMQEIIEFIQELLDEKKVYTLDDGLYFDTSTFKEYGKLSKVNLSDKNISKIENVKEKRNPADFAVWKFKKKDEPYWFAPFGEGRPGWHIECSAMSKRYLGEQFDIHGGGMDLIFPHHENELAQSECLLKKGNWVNHWMHVAYLTIDKTKMSKSLKNFIGMEELFDVYSPEVIRFYLLSAHYRTQLDFTYDKLKKAKEQWEKIIRAWYTVLQRMENKTFGGDDLSKEILHEFDHVIEALENDLKTPIAYKYINFMAAMALSNDLDETSTKYAKQAFEKLDAIFAFLPKKSWTKKEGILAQSLADMREQFRELKRFDLSDKIRDKLTEQGIKIEDTKGGPKVKFEV